ncbi:GerAB/ArcD/ProY family transporter [Aquibacillus sediminis]|uniref:GerAB/ArcD/ProY family transporter n=1 Tax=Aquibacillus sediminis TaxID=2574734 RepID=UPI0011093F7B|nr:GerAB/ArcD/ProY family transporter [Aquibacillus sediminis]
MNVNVKVKHGSRIQSFYLFFILVNIQTGTGIIGAPRYIYEQAKQDGWLSVIIAGLFVHFVVFMMFLTLKQYENTDIFGIQQDLFGKLIGKLLGTIFIIYIFASLLSVLINYIQIVQYFIHPILSPWLLSFLLLILVVYSVLGGIRVIVGVAFVFFVSTLYILFFLYHPLLEMDLHRFQPFFEASPMELMEGARATSYSLLGLEVVLFIYPFIDDKKKAQLPSQLGVAITALFLLLVTIISIGFMGRERLADSYWPILIFYKFISYEIIERFDLIVVTAWMMVVLPVMILLTWMMTYGMKRMYNIRQKKTLFIICFLLFIGGGLMKEQVMITNYTSYVGQIGFWLTFIYPIILYPLVRIKKALKKEGKN